MTSSHPIAAALLAAACLMAGAGGPVRASATVDVVAADLEQRTCRLAISVAEARIESPDRFEVLSCRFTRADVAPMLIDRLEPFDVQGPNASGYIRVAFRVWASGAPAGEARAVVRGRVRGPALVARQTLRRGERIGGDAVALEDQDLTRLTATPLRSPEQLAAKVPARSLGPGRIVTENLIEPLPVVRRGDEVDLSLIGPGYTVTVRGTVLEDGAPGETVDAENATTGARLRARVESDGTLRLVSARHGGSNR